MRALVLLCLACLFTGPPHGARAEEPLSPLAGREVLWTSFRTGDTEIFRANLATGDLVNLTRSPGSSERYPSWSPDGSKVAFNSDRDGTHNLFLMDADGGHVRQLTHEKTPVVAGMQSWTADGQWIYFGLFGAGPPRICRIHPDGSGFELVANGIDAAVKPDGSAIAFARDGEGGHVLVLLDLASKTETRLTETPNPFAGVHCTWAPDGSFLVYADKVDESLELFRVAPDGSQRVQLTHFGHGQAATSPDVSSDGQLISFRLCDEVYWRDGKLSEKAYQERRGDKRPVWVVNADGSDPRLVEPLHYQTTIDGSRAPFRPAKTYPKTGAIADPFPEVGGGFQQLDDGIYVLEEPRRTREQLSALDALLPGLTFTPPANRHAQLAETMRKLRDGRPLHIVALGDSIINDAARSAWVLRLRQRYPASDIRMTTIVRGGTGCWYYRENDRVSALVAPQNPDLVILGGLSERDVDSIRDVILQLRKVAKAEILVTTGVYGGMDPYRPETLEGGVSGYGTYGPSLRRMAEEEHAAFFDLTRAWVEAVRSTGWPLDDYKRDPVHANSRGEQLLGRALDAFFAPELDSPSR